MAISLIPRRFRSSFMGLNRMPLGDYSIVSRMRFGSKSRAPAQHKKPKDAWDNPYAR